MQAFTGHAGWGVGSGRSDVLQAADSSSLQRQAAWDRGGGGRACDPSPRAGSRTRGPAQFQGLEATLRLRLPSPQGEREALTLFHPLCSISLLPVDFSQISAGGTLCVRRYVSVLSEGRPDLDKNLCNFKAFCKRMVSRLGAESMEFFFPLPVCS